MCFFLCNPFLFMEFTTRPRGSQTLLTTTLHHIWQSNLLAFQFPATEDDLKGSGPPMRISKTCVKNFLTVVLILIYLMLTTVAGFLAYQTISDLLEKFRNPVMSVTYKEVDTFAAPGWCGEMKNT